MSRSTTSDSIHSHLSAASTPLGRSNSRKSSGSEQHSPSASRAMQRQTSGSSHGSHVLQRRVSSKTPNSKPLSNVANQQRNGATRAVEEIAFPPSSNGSAKSRQSELSTERRRSVTLTPNGPRKPPQSMSAKPITPVSKRQRTASTSPADDKPLPTSPAQRASPNTPRNRAVTGNLTSRKRSGIAAPRSVSTPHTEPRQRSLSASSIAPDVVPPWTINASPLLYKSDHLQHSATSDSLASLASRSKAVARQQEHPESVMTIPHSNSLRT